MHSRHASSIAPANTRQVARKENTFKLRLPFPRAANDRKDVKTLIVEMTRAAAAAAAGGAESKA